MNVEEQELIIKFLNYEKPKLIEQTLKKWIKINKNLDNASVSLVQINNTFIQSKAVK